MTMIRPFARTGLPTLEYLEFVSKLLRPQTRYLFDPFTIDLRNYPNEEESAYLARRQVHNNLPGTRVIIGREGCGKTQIFRQLRRTFPDENRTLSVSLPLTEMAIRVPEEDGQKSKVSYLTLEILIAQIFDTYWQKFVNDSNRRNRHIAQFSEPKWLYRLHWFYNHYRPAIQEIEDEPELTDWLNKPLQYPLLRDSLSPEDALNQLAQLVVGTLDSQELFDRVNAPPPYARIEILIDGLERFPKESAAWLIHDMQRLYDLRLGFKLFIPMACCDLLDHLECARQGRIAIYEIPPWSAGELSEMLSLRWMAFQPGAQEGANWSDLLPNLEFKAQKELLPAIIDSALQAYRRPLEELDAPIHALRLLRTMIYAILECENNEKGLAFDPILTEKGQTALSVEDIRRIAQAYWE